MSWWVYKCNSKNPPKPVRDGNWDTVFKRAGPSPWGSTEWTRRLHDVRVGDRVLAYQTDTNQLVGVAEVVRFRRRGREHEIVLRPIEELRVRIRPLKQQDARPTPGQVDGLDGFRERADLVRLDKN